MKRWIYELYKGDELLSIGTVFEIAEEMNIKVNTVRFYSTPKYAERVSEKGRRLVLIDKGEDHNE